MTTLSTGMSSQHRALLDTLKSLKTLVNKAGSAHLAGGAATCSPEPLPKTPNFEQPTFREPRASPGTRLPPFPHRYHPIRLS